LICSTAAIPFEAIRLGTHAIANEVVIHGGAGFLKQVQALRPKLKIMPDANLNDGVVFLLILLRVGKK
jgi:hypothetical protein